MSKTAQREVPFEEFVMAKEKLRDYLELMIGSKKDFFFPNERSLKHTLRRNKRKLTTRKIQTSKNV